MWTLEGDSVGGGGIFLISSFLEPVEVSSSWRVNKIVSLLENFFDPLSLLSKLLSLMVRESLRLGGLCFVSLANLSFYPVGGKSSLYGLTLI
jgi:hypothetical protein